MEIVKLEGVTKIYGDGVKRVWALDQVDLTVKKGEFLAVIGSSGSGKSTLLNSIGGVDRINDGKILVEGKDISRIKDDLLSIYRRRKVGFVFQQYQLIPVLNVEENIMMPAMLDHKKVDEEYMGQLMDMLGLRDRAKHLPGELSGGQQQRVAIARALINRPAILLADEPTGALDSKKSKEVMALLKESVKTFNQTLIFVTHNLDLAREADRMVKMEDGKLYE